MIIFFTLFSVSKSVSISLRACCSGVPLFSFSAGTRPTMVLCYFLLPLSWSSAPVLGCYTLHGLAESTQANSLLSTGSLVGCLPAPALLSTKLAFSHLLGKTGFRGFPIASKKLGSPLTFPSNIYAGRASSALLGHGVLQE